MRIESIKYVNFRSAKLASLDKCGRLNILIGRNNSGKSNLLSGLTSFFKRINPQGLVQRGDAEQIEPDLYRDTRGQAKESEIIVQFEITDVERTRIVADISAEAPQMKNALEGLDPTMRLEISLAILRHPGIFYVRSISLVAPERDDRSVLLEVSAESAIEIANRESFEGGVRREIGALEDFRDYMIEERERGREREMLRDREYLRTRFLRRYPPSVRNDLIQLVGLLDEPGGIPEFKSRVDGLIARKQDALDQPAITSELRTFAGQSKHIPEYVTNLLAAVKAFSVLYLDEARKPVGEEEARRLLSLKMRRGGSAELQAIQSTVANLLGVQIDAFESGQSAVTADGKRVAEMDVDEILVQMNGSGIREALRLILDVNFENPQALLLEEPEVHLHPALEHSILQYLKQQSERCQIFLTTHSTNFVDTAEDSAVYMVRRVNDTSVQRMTLDSIEADIPRELGIRLSSVFMYERLVFVEGPSDELALRELAYKLDINLAEAGIGFVQMGGARSYAHYVNAATIEVLAKRRVKMHIILDRDERSADQIDQIARTCKDKAEVHVLKKREIENYLLVPEAIAQLIAFKTGGVRTPATEEIEVLLGRQINDLQDLTIIKATLAQVCGSVHFDRKGLFAVGAEGFLVEATDRLTHMIDTVESMRASLRDAYESNRTSITGRWSTDSVDLVAGADLLEAVMKEFGLRYRKGTDCASLARLLPAGSVDNEVRAILQKIVS